MDVYALDSSFRTVSVGSPYTNLQWNRKYYEAGDFQMEVPLSQFDPSWAYIGTPDRPELGIVQKIQYSGEGDTRALLSGFFYEKRLDDKACYPRYIGDTPNTETAVRAIFGRYKKDLPIELAPANDPLLGDRTRSDFSDDPLGKKLYSILESRECTYSVVYDYEDDRLLFRVWQGRDRTQSQSANSFQVFSTSMGNIADKSANLDDSGFKNYAIVPANAGADGKEQNTYYLDWSNGGYRREITFDMRSMKPDDGQSMADFEAAVLQEAAEKLAECAKVEDVDIEQADGSGYMSSFDIGDRCDVVLSDIGVSMEARIVEVREVFKANGGHRVEIGLGNKRISNVERAVFR